jgi:hypothetical protein
MRIASVLTLAIFVCLVAPTIAAAPPAMTIDATGVTDGTGLVKFSFTLKNTGKLKLGLFDSWLTKLNIDGTDIDVTKCFYSTNGAGLTGTIDRAPIKIASGTKVTVTISVLLNDGKTSVPGAGDVTFNKP